MSWQKKKGHYNTDGTCIFSKQINGGTFHFTNFHLQFINEG